MHDAEREPVHERQYAVGRALGLCASEVAFGVVDVRAELHFAADGDRRPDQRIARPGPPRNEERCAEIGCV